MQFKYTQLLQSMWWKGKSKIKARHGQGVKTKSIRVLLMDTKYIYQNILWTICKIFPSIIYVHQRWLGQAFSQQRKKPILFINRPHLLWMSKIYAAFQLEIQCNSLKAYLLNTIQIFAMNEIINLVKATFLSIALQHTRVS